MNIKYLLCHREDLWWDTALDCVECLPNGLDMLQAQLLLRTRATEQPAAKRSRTGS